jgi:hypothetical protein
VLAGPCRRERSDRPTVCRPEVPRGPYRRRLLTRLPPYAFMPSGSTVEAARLAVVALPDGERLRRLCRARRAAALLGTMARPRAARGATTGRPRPSYAVGDSSSAETGCIALPTGTGLRQAFHRGDPSVSRSRPGGSRPLEPGRRTATRRTRRSAQPRRTTPGGRGPTRSRRHRAPPAHRGART